MPVPNTKVLLNSTILAGGGYSFTTNAAGDLAPTVTGSPTAQWVAGIADLNGDGLADFVFGAPGDDDKAPQAGRIFVSLGAPIAGNSGILGAGSAGTITIDGVHAGDLAGTSVGSITDLNGDGRAEILVGAPGMDKGAALDAGAAFVLWGLAATGGIDLADPFAGAGSGKGYAIKGEAAGDAAGGVVLSVGDMNGDGLADVLVGAAGNDAGGTDAGAAYVVWGKANDAVVQLTNVAAGAGGFKIVGGGGGDAVGSVLAALSDQNGDGRSEILIGVRDDSTGGANAGAVYVVDGKATGGVVNLANVANGIGGYIITGAAQDDAGAAVANAGDVNGDGRDDILIGAPRSDRAYVVYGQSGHANVDLANVRNGVGGFQIVGEAAGDLDGLSVTGGVDLNRDGIEDFVIGAAGNEEGGANSGAVYVVWGGGGTGTVDLSLIAQGIGGAKIVGAAGSLTGSTVAITADANGDGVADLIIGAPGVGEGVKVLFTPASWQPDHNIYGTAGADLMTAGYGGAFKIGAGADNILGLGGNDTIDGAGGNDTIEGGIGADSLLGGLGNDRLDGGTGADAMLGGAGDDSYVVDVAGDSVTELAGEGSDTVLSSVNCTLAAEVENLTLTAAGRVGTGNSGANVLTGSTGSDTLNGGLGADTLIGGTGADLLVIDNIGDVVVEAAGGGTDTVRASVDYVLGAEVENLILTGAARSGSGNGLANALTGTAGADMLDGAAGDDTMAGGAGNDTYVVDSLGDVIVEAAGGGTDTVLSGVSLTLAAEVENLVLTGAALTGTGNALANALTATAGNNTLDGGAGADTMTGGLGDDTYRIDNALDVVIEAAGGGIDTVVAAFDYTLTAGEIENLTLTGAAHHGTGNASANAITGTALADTLDGGGGADLLTGGAGDDLYVVDEAGDVVVELAGGGVDSVASSATFTLTAELENLTLTAAGTTGTGNALNNLLLGGAGGQSLIGLDGNDTLDGGTGADTMEGGNGDDTYIIDDAGDVVIETVGGGNDTVVTAFDVTTMAANIENIRLTGTAHTAVGNAGNNVLSGASGDDDLDGGGGDDLVLAGDGNDILHGTSGHDTLSGGTGDDVYLVHGGAVDLEDFLGHDTLDASGSTSDDHIDLSGETDSEIEHEICHVTPGGTTAGPLDVQFLQDRTGSFADDIATVRGLVPQITAALQMVQANSLFGVSSFVDKPVSPFGAPGEWVYQQQLALSADTAGLAAAYSAMTTLNGVDQPEAQIEALMQLALHAAEVGYRPDSARFVVLFTDAPYHVAGDGAAGGILTPNNGDAFFPAGGALEDYPSIAQLQAALSAANIIPIFAIAGGFEPTYQSLVDALGRGAVVTLTANSSNIVSAITAGMTAATTTHIEDANCGSGNDTVNGGVEDNHIWGNGGNDHVDGRNGNDSLDGGDGDDAITGGGGDDDLIGGLGTDTAILTGAWTDYAVTATATGYLVADLRAAGDGTDTLTDVEQISFANGTFAAGAVLNSGPVAGNDTGTLLVEANPGSAGVAVASGTVMANDSDANLATVGLGETLAVVQARAGDAAAGGILTALAGATVIDGTYGTLTLNPDGSYTYRLDNARAATDALIAGQGVVESFTYLIADAHGATAPAVLSFNITGSDEVAASVTTLADTDAGANLIAENSANGTVAGLTASGLDAGGAALLVSFGLVTDAGGTVADLAGPFQIDTATGLVTVRDGTQLNYEAATSHTIWVKATSADGASVVASFVIAVGDVFEPVVITPTLTALADSFTATTNDHYNILGLGGADIIATLAGNDTIRGGVGNDTMAGGDGNDLFTVSGTGEGYDAINGGVGFDQIVALKAATAIGVSSLAGIEAISSGGFAGVYLRGTTLANVIDLSGTTLTGIIRIEGGAGNDAISGSAAADTIVGGTGNDVLNGGGGDDLFNVAGAVDGVDAYDGGAGADMIAATLNGAAIQISALTGIEAITANGHTGVSIRGTSAANLLDFSAVTLTGITVIDAGAGNDTVIGSGGADVIAASAGLDLLTGGAGADRFDFNLAGDSRGASVDQIMDFTTGSDVIDLIGVDANSLLAGDQAFGFIGTAVFGHVAGELRLATVGGQTRLQGDIDGNGTIDFTLQLTGLVGSPVTVALGDMLL